MSNKIPDEVEELLKKMESSLKPEVAEKVRAGEIPNEFLIMASKIDGLLDVVQQMTPGPSEGFELLALAYLRFKDLMAVEIAMAPKFDEIEKTLPSLLDLIKYATQVADENHQKSCPNCTHVPPKEPKKELN